MKLYEDMEHSMTDDNYVKALKNQGFFVIINS